MNYYERYDDHNGEPLPEWLIEEGITEDGNLAFQERMFLISEILADTRYILRGEVPATIRDRVARLWSTSDDDYIEVRADIETFISVWDAIESLTQQDKE